jgi:hypothetical protein
MTEPHLPILEDAEIQQHWEELAETLFVVGETIPGEGVLLEVREIRPENHHIEAVVLGVNRNSPAEKFYSGQLLQFYRTLRGGTWRTEDRSHPDGFLRLTASGRKLFEYIT